MIVRRYLRIGSILLYSWRSILFFLGIALSAAAIYGGLGIKSVAIPKVKLNASAVNTQNVRIVIIET